jgi:hypothetical protein
MQNMSLPIVGAVIINFSKNMAKSLKSAPTFFIAFRSLAKDYGAKSIDFWLKGGGTPPKMSLFWITLLSPALLVGGQTPFICSL